MERQARLLRKRRSSIQRALERGLASQHARRKYCIGQRRVLLVLSGVLIAFLCNVGRTFLLCSVAAKSGTEAISKWHDPAGFIILSICFFVLWRLADFISGTPARLEPSKAFAPRAISSGTQDGQLHGPETAIQNPSGGKTRSVAPLHSYAQVLGSVFKRLKWE